MLQQVCQYVGLDVVHSDQGLARSKGQALRKGCAHEQGSRKAGSRGDSYLVDVVKNDTRLVQGLPEDVGDVA